MLSALVVDVVMLWLVWHWAQTRDWSDRHLLALANGTLIAHSVVGRLIYTKTMADGVAIVVLGLVTIASLARFVIRIRGRVNSEVNSTVENGSEAATPRLESSTVDMRIR